MQHQSIMAATYMAISNWSIELQINIEVQFWKHWHHFLFYYYAWKFQRTNLTNSGLRRLYWAIEDHKFCLILVFTTCLWSALFIRSFCFFHSSMIYIHLINFWFQIHIDFINGFNIRQPKVFNENTD